MEFIRPGDKIRLPIRQWSAIRMDNGKVRFVCDSFPFPIIISNDQQYKRNYVNTGFTILVLRIYVLDGYDNYRPCSKLHIKLATEENNKSDYIIVGLVRGTVVRIYGIDLSIINGTSKQK